MAHSPPILPAARTLCLLAALPTTYCAVTYSLRLHEFNSPHKQTKAPTIPYCFCLHPACLTAQHYRCRVVGSQLLHQTLGTMNWRPDLVTAESTCATHDSQIENLSIVEGGVGLRHEDRVVGTQGHVLQKTACACACVYVCVCVCVCIVCKWMGLVSTKPKVSGRWAGEGNQQGRVASTGRTCGGAQAVKHTRRSRFIPRMLGSQAAGTANAAAVACHDVGIAPYASPAPAHRPRNSPTLALDPPEPTTRLLKHASTQAHKHAI